MVKYKRGLLNMHCMIESTDQLQISHIFDYLSSTVESKNEKTDCIPLSVPNLTPS
jgi:hypothetical protein